MFWFTVIAVPVVLGSLWLNDWNTPIQNDADYIREYRVLNSTKKTDAEILLERAKDDKSKAEWKHTNTMLEKEIIKQGKESLFKDYTLQKSLLQTQFHTAYYEDNITAEEFVWKMK